MLFPQWKAALRLIFLPIVLAAKLCTLLFEAGHKAAIAFDNEPPLLCVRRAFKAGELIVELGLSSDSTGAHGRL